MSLIKPDYDTLAYTNETQYLSSCEGDRAASVGLGAAIKKARRVVGILILLHVSNNVA